MQSKLTLLVADMLVGENLVRLFRDVPLPATSGFDKHTSLLGNPRQRIAIITQMASSQKESKAHTDITQLLILGKSSKAVRILEVFKFIN